MVGFRGVLGRVIYLIPGFDKIIMRTVDLSIFVRRTVSWFTALSNVGPSTSLVRVVLVVQYTVEINHSSVNYQYLRLNAVDEGNNCNTVPFLQYYITVVENDSTARF